MYINISVTTPKYVCMYPQIVHIVPSGIHSSYTYMYIFIDFGLLVCIYSVSTYHYTLHLQDMSINSCDKRLANVYPPTVKK